MFQHSPVFVIFLSCILVVAFVSSAKGAHSAIRDAAEDSFKEEAVARRPRGGPLPSLRGHGCAGEVALEWPT